MIYTYEQICEKSKEIFEGEPDIRAAYLFGSYARGEAGENSDIDIVLETTRNIGIRVLYLGSIMEDVFKKGIDLYMESELPLLRNRILSERRPVYEAK